MQQPAFEPGPDTSGTPLDIALSAARGDPPRSVLDAALDAAASSAAQLDCPIKDWDHMFRAVLHRLRRIGASDARAQGRAAAGPALDRASVLDCVAALEQLHQALADERLQRRRHEPAARDAGVLLQQLCAEPAGHDAPEPQAVSMAGRTGSDN